MMGKAACILVGSRQAHEALFCHFSNPKRVAVTSTFVRAFSSWLSYASMLPILSPILHLTIYP